MTSTIWFQPLLALSAHDCREVALSGDKSQAARANVHLQADVFPLLFTLAGNHVRHL